MIDVNKRLDEVFGSLTGPTSDSSFDNNIEVSKADTVSNDNSSDFSVNNGGVSGNFEANGMRADYEFNHRKGISHVVLKENGNVIFRGSLEEFQKLYPEKFAKYHQLEVQPFSKAFFKGFNDGREKFRRRHEKENEKFEIRDNYDVDETPKKKRKGCSTGCVIFLILALLITIFFGSGIYHWILTMIH